MSDRLIPVAAPRGHPTIGYGLALLSAVTLWITAWPAAAEPSVWAQAADRRLQRRTATVRAVDRIMGRARRGEPQDGLTGPPRARLLRDAQRRLERAGAATADDPELRHLLARVHYGLFELDGDAAHLQAATGHLTMVVRARMPHTVRAEALNDLAMCYARLGDHRRETATYDRALKLEPHAESQAILLANQAEGFMAQGDVSRAVAGYRGSIAVTPAYALHRIAVTTWWGYAVALDRSGYLSGALEQIHTARSYDPEDLRLASDSWVYLPEYDEHWYRALGDWERARSAKQRPARLRAYEGALLGWDAYLTSSPRADVWRPLAELRRQQCAEEHRRELSRGAR